MTVRMDVLLPVPVVCAGQPLSRVWWQRASRNAYSAALQQTSAASLETCKVGAAAGDPEAAFAALDAGMRAAAAASGMHARTPRGQDRLRVDAAVLRQGVPPAAAPGPRQCAPRSYPCGAARDGAPLP